MCKIIYKTGEIRLPKDFKESERLQTYEKNFHAEIRLKQTTKNLEVETD